MMSYLEVVASRNSSSTNKLQRRKVLIAIAPPGALPIFAVECYRVWQVRDVLVARSFAGAQRLSAVTRDGIERRSDVAEVLVLRSAQRQPRAVHHMGA